MLRVFRRTLCLAVCLACGPLLVRSAYANDVRFTRGDVNTDGSVDISDAISSLLSLFHVTSEVTLCSDAADTNDDGVFDISDAVYTLGYLFGSYVAPPPPSGECGSDPTADSLSCESFAPCPAPPGGEHVAEGWTARFSVSEISHESSHALAVDEYQNVYLTGMASLTHDGGDTYPDSDMITVKYDSTGRELWAARYTGYGDGNSGQAIAIGADGHVYVGGVSGGGPQANQDIVIVKYDATGETRWEARYDSGGRDLVAAMILDDEGSVYVTGESDAFTVTQEDWVTIKYSTQGHEVWVDRYDGPGGRSDYPFALALGPDGHLYVAGSAHGGTFSMSDYTLVKYTPTGSRVWVSHYNGDGSSSDYATALGFDPLGNVYVTGRSRGVDSGFDYATVLFDASGNLLWAARYDGRLHGDDDAVALCVDGRGNVYVAGSSEDENENDFDLCVISYDRHGRIRWSASYDGPEERRDMVRGMAIREGDGIYITGYVDGRPAGDNRGQDFCTVAYDLGGQERWVALYDGPGREWDEASSVVVGQNGQVYVTGRSEMDCLTIEYVTTNSTGE